jgi:hypothetical protein
MITFFLNVDDLMGADSSFHYQLVILDLTWKLIFFLDGNVFIFKKCPT